MILFLVITILLIVMIVAAIYISGRSNGISKIEMADILSNYFIVIALLLIFFVASLMDALAV